MEKKFHSLGGEWMRIREGVMESQGLEGMTEGLLSRANGPGYDARIRRGQGAGGEDRG
jgi:hypothetical protein